MPINSTPGKNLNLCFTKIKWPLAPQSSPPMSPTSLSQDHDDADDHHHNTFPSTTTTSSSTLIKNFNSLYDSTSKSLSHSSSSLSTPPPPPPPPSKNWLHCRLCLTPLLLLLPWPLQLHYPIHNLFNWEFLHELLLCYLALNPKNTHKFIVGAFCGSNC